MSYTLSHSWDNFTLENLESLKGTFYTTALHVKHLSTEHCIAALLWGSFTPLVYYTLIEEFTCVKACQ